MYQCDQERLARYGVDIKPIRWHFEADDLTQIPLVLNGHTGKVTVFDRTTKSVAFEGTPEEILAAITGCAASVQKTTGGSESGPLAPSSPDRLFPIPPTSAPRVLVWTGYGKRHESL